MTPDDLRRVSDAELLEAHRRAWHPRNAPKPIHAWSLAELDAAAAFCDRLLEELAHRGLLSGPATHPTPDPEQAPAGPPRSGRRLDG